MQTHGNIQRTTKVVDLLPRRRDETGRKRDAILVQQHHEGPEDSAPVSAATMLTKRVSLR